MHKFHLDKSVLLCLAFAALANAAIAQQPESKNQDPKVTIIKKTFDGNGVETVEKIEQLLATLP